MSFVPNDLDAIPAIASETLRNGQYKDILQLGGIGFGRAATEDASGPQNHGTTALPSSLPHGIAIQGSTTQDQADTNVAEESSRATILSGQSSATPPAGISEPVSSDLKCQRMLHTDTRRAREAICSSNDSQAVGDDDFERETCKVQKVNDAEHGSASSSLTEPKLGKRERQTVKRAKVAQTETIDPVPNETAALDAQAALAVHPRKQNRGSAKTLASTHFATRAHKESQGLHAPIHLFKLHAPGPDLHVAPASETSSSHGEEVQDLLRSLNILASGVVLPYFDSHRDLVYIDKQLDNGFKRVQLKDEDQNLVAKSKRKTHDKKLLSFNGLNTHLRPISNISDIFADLTTQALELGFPKVLEAIGSRKLKVSTLCSGTDSPLLALQMISDSLKRGGHYRLNVEHQLSCEIEPFKQAYIQRNFRPLLLFRDVMDLKYDEAHTAFGARAPVPKQADIMIAGSSCVDYSALNMKPKSFSIGGESYDTLVGIVGYAKTHQPSIVILENVFGFPWAEAEAMWDKAGYTTKVALLDTKDFYMPQTRQRGYMIGLRRAAIREQSVDLDVKEAVQTWLKVLTKLQRRASSPFTDFIFPEGDTQLQKWSQEIASQLRVSGKNLSWDKSRMECLSHRSCNSLGFKKPFTDWENSASCSVPDVCNQLWFKRLPERVWDTVDINHLRDINMWWWDFLYKQRCIDLSQSCVREKDNSPWGILHCITASAHLYVTHRGGPLVGPEALSLQGIPTDRLILSRESNRQLIDLAGNAMTTTTVGASILAALISCYQIFTGPHTENGGTSHCNEDIPSASFPLKFDPDWMLQEIDLTSQSLSAFRMSEIRSLALKSFRLCSCEGPVSNANQSFQQCSKCGHTSCIDCGIKPPHDYIQMESELTKKRKSAMEFEECIRKILPPRLEVSGLVEAYLKVEPICPDNLKLDYKHAITSAAEAIYHLVHVKRGRNWRIQYDSQFSRLVLKFQSKWDGRALWSEPASFPTAEVVVQWNLYAKPPSQLPADSPLRETLAHPIARMNCSDFLLNGQWEIRTVSMQSFQLLVTGDGKAVPSWEQQQGLEHPMFKNRFVWPILHIQAPTDGGQRGHIPGEILGRYELLEQCGTACGALHVKQKTTECSHEASIFLFLDPAPLGNACFDSFVFAREHCRLEHNELRQLLAKVDASWRPSSKYRESRIDCKVLNQWTPVDGVHLKEYASQDVQKIFLASAKIGNLVTGTHCDTSGIPVIWFQLPMSRARHQDLALDTHLRVDLVKNPFSLDAFVWLLKTASSALAFEEWQDIQVSGRLGERCLICAPPVPSVVWRRVLTKNNYQIRPYENIEEASAYERRIQTAFDAATAHYFFDNASQQAILKVDFNILTLIHKAAAALSDSPAGAPSISSIQWRAVIDHGYQYSVSFPQMALKDCQANIASAQPPSFREPCLLNEQQSKSFAWMKGQEENPPAWYEQEVAEAHVGPLSLRLEARVTAKRLVMGGVLADDVGYGKTALILALIDHHFQTFRPISPPFVDGEDDTVCLKATLILVPRNLIPQWEREIKKFVGSMYNVLILMNCSTEIGCVASTFRGADIILTSWEFFDDYYITELARMSKAAYTPTSAGRGFEEWFEMAQEDLKKFVKASHGVSPDQYLPAWQGLEQRDYKKFQELSKRNKKGTRVTDNAEDEHQRKKLKIEVGNVTIEEPTMPFLPLHGCKFNRIVIDEFTYVETKLEPIVSALQAPRRWILSGTPIHNTFQGVSRIARLLGTSVGVPDDAASRYQHVRKDRSKDVSGGEALRSYATLRTPSWQKQRFAIAESFVSKFVRKNTAFVQGIEQYNHHHKIVLAAAERAIYSEVFLALIKDGIPVGKKDNTKPLASTRTDGIADHIAVSRFPEEALITLCSMIPEFAKENPRLFECGGAVEEKVTLICAKLEDIESELQGAFWLDSFYGDDIATVPDIQHYLRSVEKNCFGDFTIRDVMSHVIACAQAASKWTVAKSTVKHQPNFRTGNEKQEQYEMRINSSNEPRTLSKVTRIEDLKLRANSLTQWTMDLVSLVREWRFLIGAHRCETWQAIKCSSCGRQSQDYSAMLFNCRCGHIWCKACHEKLAMLRRALRQCLATGCDASSPPESVVEAADLATTFPSDSARQYGGKMTAIVDLLRQIPEHDKVLIFVQFGRIAEAVRAVLKASSISFTDTIGGGLSGKTPAVALEVERFKRAAECRVCILQLDSPNAAGWNLQIANHVVFVSSLVAQTQHEYRSTTAQAIGRVFRMGQQKNVHIYHLLADKTIEVTILEERTGKTLVERQGQRLVVDKNDVQRGDVRGFAGLHFRGAACGAGGEICTAEGDDDCDAQAGSEE